MLSRLAAAQQATTNSLQAAQDFAANAAHELRTPLTAMRADLDTLRIHDLPDEERELRSWTTCRGRSAASRRSSPHSDNWRRGNWRRPKTVNPSIHRHARPGGPGEHALPVRSRSWWKPTMTSAPSGAGRVACGWPSTTWCATRRAWSGDPHRAGGTTGGRLDVIIADDNGRGLPVEEHKAVLGRFSRGSTAAPGGSGLGLALVANRRRCTRQHRLTDGPLGGLRATLTVSAVG